MRDGLSPAGVSVRPFRFARTSLIRHAALCVAALGAYLLRDELRVGYSVLWIFGFSALLNFLTNLLHDRERFRSVARSFSAVFGIAGWTGLVFLTGGVASPFFAGFGLEILLSAIVFGPVGALLVTAGTVTGLCCQQALLGLGSASGALSLETGLLVAMGLLTLFISRQWLRTQGHLSRHARDLDKRLIMLERELKESRALSQMGEGAGRLAHGLKNAAHSLRGFTKLLEPQLSEGSRGEQALEGLRASIERLEEMVRATLRPAASRGTKGEPGRATGTQVEQAMKQVCDEVGRIHPRIRWVCRIDDTLPDVAIPRSALREVVLVLVQNAAEASGGRGEVRVSASADNGILRIDVGDRGPGISRRVYESLFKAGYTTKTSGNGFGLFLARRLVESQGGELTVGPAGDTGAVFSATLPLAGKERPDV